MSTALSWELPEVHHDPAPTATAHCLAGEGGVAIAARCRDSLRLLVAADVGRYALMVSHTFRRAVNDGAPLGVVADLLDEAVTRVAMTSVCATLVDVSSDGFTVLHRGGPSPVVFRSDGALTRVIPAVPGPPLGPHDSVTCEGHGELVPATHDDVLLVTTPGSVEPAIRAMASAVDSTLPELWSALRGLCPTETGSAYALVSGAPHPRPHPRVHT